jgi:hypothetical protein
MSTYAQWNPNTTYVIGDIVEFAGFNYIAAAVNQNVSPFPTNATWTLLPSGGGGGGGVSGITAGNSNIVIGGTVSNPTVSGTLTALTSNVATTTFSFNGNTAGSASFVVGAGQNFRVITTDLSPQILVGSTGVEFAEAGTGYTVRSNILPPAGNNSTQVATTAFVHRSQVNTLNFYKPLFPTLVKQSIIYHNPSTTITATTIDAQLDGLPAHPQYLSYGATIPNLYVIVGEGTTDTLAVSTDGINYQGLGKIFSSWGAGVAYSGSLNRWVAVGRGTQTIYYSTTGLTWTNVASSTSIFTESSAVFWNGTRFLAGGVGSPNTIASSLDGTSWSGQGTSIFSTRCNGFATDGEITVAVGVGTNHVAYSFNGGLDWTGLGAIMGSLGGTSVCWNGSRFIATFEDNTGGGNTIAYSTNGIIWVGNGMIFDSQGLGVATNNIIQVAVGGFNFQIYVSYDGGNNWNPNSSAGLDGLGFGVIWSGSLWVVVGAGTSVNVVYSSDGNSWFNAVQPINLNVRGVAFNYDRSHRVSFPVNRSVVGGGGGATTLAYSNNGGKNWNNIGDVLNTIVNGLAVRTLTPDTGNYLYVAVGQGTAPSAHTVALSNNGINWRVATSNPFTPSAQYVAYGNRWVAVGSGSNTIADSTDGDTWTGQGNTVFTTRGQAVAYNGTNMWVAVGSGGNNVANSTTGTSFLGLGAQPFISGAGRGVVWGTDKFVIVGSGAVSIGWSSDGLTFSPVPASASICPTLNEVAHNGSLFMAVGITAGGTHNILTSPDGITWTGVATTDFANVLGVCWVGDKWVITGSGTIGGISNRVAYSTNVAGTEWVYLGTQQFATSGQAVVWNGSLGTPIIPASSIVLNSTNSKKLDVFPAPYANGGYSNITMTVKT